ncbi:hypothetical protein A1O3_05932 [Capronia epimyces CBS 606.96]|uniref:DUF895 domain membrane protein n=1 Tax=Capronia epimyces CBS 606.96 TaxID=1182542 RepID=W9XXH5_9EURO|nr:uncharacterized protein A1O3_05932 [Capronia epimyces CBS 606.96]EXJ85257.1 hypothetical protein A1O3_05932 [Capronia epimyces CBS 606.96]
MSLQKIKHLLRNPYTQNFIIGIEIGLTGGLYVALNLLGAAGGKPDSASTINTANSVLCACYAVSAFFGGTVLNKLGPAITACLGTVGYTLYIGSLWHFDQYAVAAFPIFAAACLGISMSYSEENERGSFVAVSLNLQAVGSIIGGFIPLIINRNKATSAGVPVVVYAVFIAMDIVAAVLAFTLQPPGKVIRKDGTNIADLKPRTLMQELVGNFEALKDWKLWIMLPAFLPSQSYLVYGGSVNVYLNSLRARSLLSFCAVTLQVFLAWGLRWLLDYQKFSRRTRALAGLTVVGVPLMAAWIWEVIRVRHYDRHRPPTDPTDWDEGRFAPVFILFMLNWCASALFQYVIMYFLGCFTNNPRKAANNAGIFRAFLAVGEAVSFAVDSRKTKYVIEAGLILAFYAVGLLLMGYLAVFHIGESKYFQEEEVTIPEHVKLEHQHRLEATEGVDPADKIEIGFESKSKKSVEVGP